MRIVHIAYLYGTNNTGGACIAASRLHLALLQHGVDSHFICCQKKEAGSNVHELPARGILRAIQYVITRVVWILGYLTPERRIIMPNLVPLLTLNRTLRKIKPDIVHIHWYMMDTISFWQLANIPYPVVMTLHDLFDVSIEAPYPAQDRRFTTGLTPTNSTKYERWIFARKRQAMQAAKPFMTGPSKWACEQACASIIGKDLNYRTISNIFDDSFHFDPQHLQKHEKFRLLFGANGGRENPEKGWSDLVHAFSVLPDAIKSDMEVYVFGEEADDCCEAGISIHFLGKITSADNLCQVYHAADLFVFPSRMETQGMVKIEAMLCGLPVIAFNRSACAESIEHGHNGWVAEDGDYRGFADGIEHFLRLYRHSDYLSIRSQIARDTFKKFNKHAIVKAFLDVYRGKHS